MELRLLQEAREEKLLGEYAQKSVATKGREKSEEKCDIRTDFQRDRDRIIHCKSFRRMKHKTQVFISPEGDHYRTRLTHTLEVSQIARSIARALNLNEDLTEAIALGHDLGHTPFGHAGERKLSKLCEAYGSFAHNEQSLRVVDRLEKNGEGLNLTWEVRDGILNHRTSCKPATMEGKVVQLSDKIAYTNHDIDDAVRAGMLTPEDIPPEIVALIGTTSSSRINAMIRDTITNSARRNEIRMSVQMRETLTNLRDFMFRNVYMSDIAMEEHEKADKIIGDLYEYYWSHPEVMEGEFLQLLKEGEPLWKVVCDYIACMTDRFAVAKYTELFIPKEWGRL
ncbi:deoxyguanosinetriphosphate triphosphohydrolase [Anaerotignum neopropionicum]|uniref:Deoxyguanosinetriphosphate triphosphohydrolase-like protein n=1 Tax=Anaerotignum neopropionicum TaxID=36847 RepID=A0A136WHH2_9FIRM|nr:deoxyguanosinetriphosphate triphosphohydrolase [Anaerotignum neopropionicum]KXL54018.1 deoxyguanosinetriphosphate triphosphohydrolase [Anaerotignum neopropionicum]